MYCRMVIGEASSEDQLREFQSIYKRRLVAATGRAKLFVFLPFCQAKLRRATRTDYLAALYAS